MRNTARAIILKDKKLLLVTGHDAGFYWTPGGGIDEGETSIQALHRELGEELNATILNCEHYVTYEHADQHVMTYLVEVGDGWSIGDEITGYIWFSKNDTISVSQGLKKILLPQLMRDGLL